MKFTHKLMLRVELFQMKPLLRQECFQTIAQKLLLANNLDQVKFQHVATK